MSLTSDSRSWSSTPPIINQVILGLIIPGIGLTTILLGLYGYAAWKPVSRRYLDRVSFRLLTYALIAHLSFGVSFTVAVAYPGRQCALISFLSNISLVFSAGMFFSIAVNLPLVLALNVSGRRMEKYYVLGSTLIGMVSSLAPYVSGKLGWDDVNETCWYLSKDPSAMLGWLVGTQTVWILLASFGEVVSFMVIVGYLVVYRLVSEDTPTSSSTLSHKAGSTILRFRNIILRIGLYPLVSCILNISTAVIEFCLFQTRQKNNWRMYLSAFAIYAGRPLIYGLLAATDPAFIRALRVLRHPENESQTLSQIRTPGLEMSTIIYLPQDEISVNEQNKNTPESSLEEERVAEMSTISTPDVNPEMRKGQPPVDGNGTGASIEVMSHI